jgi:hypothetical protein
MNPSDTLAALRANANCASLVTYHITAGEWAQLTALARPGELEGYRRSGLVRIEGTNGSKAAPVRGSRTKAALFSAAEDRALDRLAEMLSRATPEQIAALAPAPPAVLVPLAVPTRRNVKDPRPDHEQPRHILVLRVPRPRRKWRDPFEGCGFRGPNPDAPPVWAPGAGLLGA